jgi:hypothetical protein
MQRLSCAGPLFDTFPAREVKLGSFTAMRALPIRDGNE